MRLYKFLSFIFSSFLKALFFVKVSGEENVPKSGACFVCCNHISNCDPVILSVSVKRPLRYMAKKELFNIPVLKQVITALGAFPVDRGKADIGAIKTSIALLEDGEAVGIFPQGRRCRGIKPTADGVKSGTGMMVYRTQVDVVPVAITTKNYKVRLFKRIYVNIGKPIKFEEYNVGERSSAEYQKISKEIFERIAALDEESSRYIK